MLSIENLHTWLILLILGQTSGLSYNQPKLCPNASWNPNALTFANSSAVGVQPQAVFVDTNNTVYVVAQALNQVLVWSEGNNNPIRTISGGLNNPFGVFVTTSGDVYVDNGRYNHRVDKWMLNATTSVAVRNVTGGCFNLFIDINDTLYCSIDSEHKVVKTSLSNGSNDVTIAAGNGTQGSGPYMLYWPNGIYVDLQLNLYVADCGNNRIQLFRPGELNGTTVVGNGAPSTITLNLPSGIAVDSDGYLFISEESSNRIIGSGPSGFRCIFGCSGLGGNASDQLSNPRYLAFDSSGNLFVTDMLNNRIQKFLLMENSCEETTTSQQILISTSNNGDSSTNSIQSTITTSLTSESQQSTAQPPLFFVPRTCYNPSLMGINCNISQTPCDMLNPCQYNSTCTNTGATGLGYSCSCQPGFNGTHCEFDYRPCKPNTCWNNGLCNETSNTTFVCSCELGWEGIYCERKTNYCQNITCQNKGVCRPLFRNYTCECLSESFSGRYCEITASSHVVRQVVSRSFGYIGYSALIICVAFIVIMDILKYCFGIDPTRKELEQIRREKFQKKHKPVIQRFVYVNAPTLSQPPASLSKNSVSMIEETAV